MKTLLCYDKIQKWDHYTCKSIAWNKITIMKHIFLIKIHSKRAFEDFISHHVLFLGRILK